MLFKCPVRAMDIDDLFSSARLLGQSVIWHSTSIRLLHGKMCEPATVVGNWDAYFLLICISNDKKNLLVILLQCAV